MTAARVDRARCATPAWQPIASELARGGLRHTVLRETSASALFLIAADDMPRLEASLRACGFRTVESAGAGRIRIETECAPDPDAVTIEAVAELSYGGRAGWFATGEPEERILRRARAKDGGCSAARQDELVDRLLHCILDLRDFPTEHRQRLTEAMAELRRDPVSAGRAAERVQQELAPALTWAETLDAVVHERWTDLLARRGALRALAHFRAPLRSAGRWLAGTMRGRGLSNGRTISPPSEVAPAAEAVSRRQIRGSGLLLAGRGFSTGLKFFSELLVARYLTTTEYGSWTYALAAVAFLRGFAALGLHRAVARFMPVHLERGDRDQFVGLLAFVLGSLVVSGTAVILTFYAFPDAVSRLVGGGPGQRLDILFVVVFLVPVEALDDFLTAVCAAFHDSRAIFVRRYVLSPGFRLGLALVLVLMGADVRLLAYGYLASGLVGLAYYGWSVYGEARRRGLVPSTIELRLPLPVRRTLGYTLPVMGADLCTILMSTAAPLLLGYFKGMNEVALFQVVLPLVALNTLVAQSFGVLFEPTASRLYQKGDLEALDRLYWRSAIWVAVLTFPALVVCVAAAEPLTAFLFGERYASAAPILSIVALGVFADAALGFNAATLRVAGKLRWLLAVNISAAAVTVVLNLLLIPPLGALGAAIATGVSWGLYALAKQAALRLATGVRMFDRAYAAIYGAMAVTTAALVVLKAIPSVGPYVLGTLIVGATFVVLHRARATLSVTDTFPELGRWPALARLLG